MEWLYVNKMLALEQVKGDVGRAKELTLCTKYAIQRMICLPNR